MRRHVCCSAVRSGGYRASYDGCWAYLSDSAIAGNDALQTGNRRLATETRRPTRMAAGAELAVSATVRKCTNLERLNRSGLSHDSRNWTGFDFEPMNAGVE